MASSLLTTKGQITIPVEIRNALGLKTGDRLEFLQNRETGRVEMTRKTGSLMDLAGMLKYDGPSFSIEEMNQAVIDHVLEDDERIKREWHAWKEQQS